MTMMMMAIKSTDGIEQTTHNIIELVTNPFEGKATSFHAHGTFSCKIVNGSNIVFSSYYDLHYSMMSHVNY